MHLVGHQLDHTEIINFIQHMLGGPCTARVHANRCQHRACIDGLTRNANNQPSKERSDLTPAIRLGQSKPPAKRSQRQSCSSHCLD